MNRLILFFFLFFSYTINFAQEIHFDIKNEAGQPILFCNVLFKEKSTNSTLEFAKISSKNPNYTLKKKYQTLLIEVTSTGYFNEVIEVLNPIENKKYSFSVVLKESKTKQLEEVVIKTPDRPYKIKKDTIVFDVQKYRDGTERKVEDLIKKLPGIEVDNSGTIKYKGKQLETVTLDGDNLFNRNYKVGTKNINIDIVEQIEAIENYTNNKLLKGIESDGKVALNLKLKKGKSDYSGSTENALGLNNNHKLTHYAHLYLMQISKKVKSFATINSNNIGRSDAYFYEKNKSVSMDSKSDEDFKTQQLISNELFNPKIDPIRYNLNRQLFASYNNLFKIDQNIVLKSNFNFINDKINSVQNISTTNSIGSDIIETKDAKNATNKPTIFTAEIELKINTTKKTLLEIYNKQYWENSKYQNRYIKNDELGFLNNNHTKNYLSINKLVHTWKVSNQQALQGNLYYTSNEIPQLFESLNTNQQLYQTNKYTKDVFLVNYNFLGKLKKHNYTFQLGTNFEQTKFISENNLATNNNDLFKNYSIYSFSRMKFNFGKTSLIPSILVSNYHLKLLNGSFSEMSTKKNIFEPSLEFTYKSGKSLATLIYSYNQKPIKEDVIYTQQVITSNRTLNFNIPSLEFKKTQSVSFQYRFTNLSNNTNFSFSSLYEKSNGQFLQEFNVDKEFTVIKNKFYKEPNSNLNFNLKTSSFIEKLQTTFTHTSSLNFLKYPNTINNSDIRKNSNLNFKNTFEFRTGFLTKLNFENAFTINTIQSKSEIYQNKNNSLQNNFKIKYRISKKLSSNLKSDLFITDLENNNRCHFMDLELKYKATDKMNFFLLGNNLLNEKYYQQKSNTDYSAYISQTNVTPRYFLLTMEYNF